MQSDTQTAPTSTAMLWTGRIMSALPALFLLFDGAMKLVKPEFVVKATTDLGYDESVILPLGIVLIACTVLYLIPSTSVLGAILLTGYLGGAVATHVHHRDGLFYSIVSGHFRRVALGRACPARRPAARTPSSANLEPIG